MLPRSNAGADQFDENPPRVEAIEGFNNVKSLQEILKPVSQEVRILKNQHEARVAAMRETTTAKRGRAKG